MMRQIYRLLPASIRTKIWLSVEKKIRQQDLILAEEEERKLPKVELKPLHIQNLRVLIDRDALLNVLPKRSVVAEIGVASGEFSDRIVSIVNPSRLYLIDSWSHDERYQNSRRSVEDRFMEYIEMEKVLVRQGFSTTELQKFDDAFFDWVYIDTSHDYESTAEELELCRKKVKNDGIIAGHDYTQGAWLSRARFGVVEAVNEFCVKYNWEMIYLTHEAHRHLSFALKVLK